MMMEHGTGITSCRWIDGMETEQNEAKNGFKSLVTWYASHIVLCALYIMHSDLEYNRKVNAHISVHKIVCISFTMLRHS